MVKPSPLVGRRSERAGIDAVLAGCRRGEGGLVLVSGDAGMGKSRLVAEALADVDLDGGIKGWIQAGYPVVEAGEP